MYKVRCLVSVVCFSVVRCWLLVVGYLLFGVLCEFFFSFVRVCAIFLLFVVRCLLFVVRRLLCRCCSCLLCAFFPFFCFGIRCVVVWSLVLFLLFVVVCVVFVVC